MNGRQDSQPLSVNNHLRRDAGVIGRPQRVGTFVAGTVDVVQSDSISSVATRNCGCDRTSIEAEGQDLYLLH